MPKHHFGKGKKRRRKTSDASCLERRERERKKGVGCDASCQECPYVHGVDADDGKRINLVVNGALV